MTLQHPGFGRVMLSLRNIYLTLRTNMDNKDRYNTSTWLILLVFQCCLQLSGSLMYWTAYVEIRYFDRENNETRGSICECGVFGLNALVDSASGLVVLPNSDPLACSENTTFTASHRQWIALIKKGNCTYSQKIQAAQRKGASAVVIYNVDGTGNATNLMKHSDADDIVAIMIGNILGTEITSLSKNGTDVYMAIIVANPYGLWLWAYALFFTFVGITSITLFYFAFLFIKRLYLNRQRNMEQKKTKKEAKKAIAKLLVRMLRRGDPEIESEDMSCAVCTDSFKLDEQVTILPCRHLYHKKCIEPWFLMHPTCPICKYNILEAKMNADRGEQYFSTSSDVWFCPSVTTLTLDGQHEVSQPNVQTAETAAGNMSDHVNVQTQQVYTNPAFEEEPVSK